MFYIYSLNRFLKISLFIVLSGLISQTPSYASDDVPLKTIIISCEDWVGYCNKDGSGWYLDVLREIYAKENITIQLKSEPFARSLESVKNGSANALLVGYNIPERRANYSFPKIRLDNEQTVALSKPNKPTYEITLPKARVAYPRGSAYENYFNPSMVVIPLNHRTQGIELLQKDRIGYFLDDFMDSLQAISEAHMKPEDFVFTRITTKALYILFEKNKQGQALADIYDRGIVELYESGRLKQLAQQYNIPDFSFYYPEMESLAKTNKSPNKPQPTNQPN